MDFELGIRLIWLTIFSCFLVYILLIYISLRSKAHGVYNLKILSSFRKHLKSEWRYWLYLVLFLSMVEIVLACYLIPNRMIGHDLGINLVSEILGLLFTIVFLSWLFNLRENLEWESIKQRLLSRMGSELYLMSAWLMNMCRAPSEASLNLSRREDFFRCLKELSERRTVDIWDESRELILSGFFSSYFEDHERNLGEIEARAREKEILEVKVVGFLIDIRRNLRSLSLYLRKIERLPKEIQEAHKNEYSDGICVRIHKIIRNVNKMHENGIEIYRED